MRVPKPKFVASSKSLCLRLEKQLSGRRFVLLTEERVNEVCMPVLFNFLQVNTPMDVVEVESGEACKAPEVCIELWSHLLELRFTKNDVLVCIGGGSLTDLCGFVASTYKRGVPCILIPTTLLAMTDASVGGKNGVDIGSVKNVVGTISQPEAVFIYTGFCETLPRRQFWSGMAEIMKHAIIAGGELWHAFERISESYRVVESEVLKKSIEVKLAIVRKDVMESGLRRILNFGHTIGHAVEAASIAKDATSEHGIAVAFGMLVESTFARNIGMLHQGDYLRIANTNRKLFKVYYNDMPDWQQIEPYIRNDKKAGPKAVSMLLPSAIGVFEAVHITDFIELKKAYSQVFLQK